ncbi:MAG: 4Fe-4S binding protein [Desulfobacter sp.]|nr:4Fe-4S binding protein [Desulfobacter sp.]WDP88206.1 MAG: 4Fe-4S binding protein [Desulfobacter sp.]
MAYTISDACIGCRACALICPATAISGEKKQLHFIDGQACIECGACGRVCPSGAVTDEFGLVLERIPKKEWERPYFDLSACLSCTVCLDTCPTGALTQERQKVGSTHLFPCLENEKLCIACGFCVQDCPVDAVTMGARQSAPPKEPVKAG